MGLAITGLEATLAGLDAGVGAGDGGVLTSDGTRTSAGRTTCVASDGAGAAMVVAGEGVTGREEAAGTSNNGAGGAFEDGAVKIGSLVLDTTATACCPEAGRIEIASGKGRLDAPLTTTSFSPGAGMTAATRAATARGCAVATVALASWTLSLACRPLAASFASRSSSRALRRASFGLTGDVATTATRSGGGAVRRAAAEESTGRNVSASIACANPVPLAGNVPK